MRVGVSPHEGWAEVVDGEGVGREAELVEGFAESIDADVEWVEGGEEHLMEALEAGDLDLVIGGLSDATPWTTHAAITRPYLTTTDASGASTNHVMAAPLGENAFLVALETFLTEELRRRRARPRSAPPTCPNGSATCCVVPCASNGSPSCSSR